MKNTLLKFCFIKKNMIKCKIYIIKKENMIFNFLKKRKKTTEKIELIKIMFVNLKIPESQKSLYIQALDVLDES